MDSIKNFETLNNQEFPVSWFDSDLGNFFAVTVKGEALAPLYCEGDTVIIKCDVPKYREGVTYYIEVNGNHELRQLRFIKDENSKNDFILISPSSFIAPLFVPANKIKIFGTPYMIIRKLDTEVTQCQE